MTSLIRHAFLVSAPRHDKIVGGWWFEVRGEQVKVHGPFRNEAAATEARTELFRKWHARAETLGGRAAQQSFRRWFVFLPEGVRGRGIRTRGR
ncbi:MAG: hypothetical protein KTR31_21375 [Myxococcales bacterium]|nr:hypothetical protein [Myxococcales bacterium]